MLSIILTTIVNTVLLILAYYHKDTYIKVYATVLFISAIYRAFRQEMVNRMLEDMLDEDSEGDYEEENE